MRIGLISDTHGKLRSEVFDALRDVDLILHAGDIGSLDIVTELATIAPVQAVHGNTDDFDVRNRYGEALEVDADGRHIVVVHGHLLGAPTPARLRAQHPHADAIVYGHTHQALLDDSARPLVVNPGAAGPARFRIKPSVAVLEVPEMSVRFIDL